MPRKSIPLGKNSGIKYEEFINELLKEKGLCYGITGGASSNPDLYIYYKDMSIPVEVKQDLTADFAQVELRWNKTDGFYYSENMSRNALFRQILADKTDFLDKINNTWTESPIKFTKNHHSIADLESDLDNFPDIKEKIDASLIEEFYTSKNPAINYMQIGGKGFYYLKNNSLSLNSDRLVGEAVLRARVKTRSRTDKKWGFLVAIKLTKVTPSRYDIEEKDGKTFPFSL